MKQLKEYVQELEENYNDLLSIYQKGKNETGKSKDQLLNRFPDYHAFKKAYESNTDANLDSRIFRLKKNFRNLIENQFVAKSIAGIIFINYYKVNNYGDTEVSSHLFEQVRKLEFVIETDDSSVAVEVIEHNSGKRVNVSNQFISRLSELEYDGELIFEDDIENMIEFRKKIEVLMSKRFNEMPSPLNFKVSLDYIAHYIITELMGLVGLRKNFTPLKSVILINGASFKSSARSNSWNKSIQPRLDDKSKDPFFEDLVLQLQTVLNILS